jgi:hypothetical protein
MPKKPTKPPMKEFPVLGEWMEKHAARICWETHVPGTHIWLECWIFMSGRIGILMFNAPEGMRPTWDIYSTDESIGVAESLKDAEERLKLFTK